MTRERAIELARGKWRGLLAKLGIEDRLLDGKKHPCPRNGEGTDRFRFTDRDGRGSFFCHCDDGGYARNGRAGGVSLLMCCRGWTYQKACEEVEKIVGTVERAAAPRGTTGADDIKTRQAKILATCVPVGDAVVTYLAARGLQPTDRLRQGRAVYWDSTGDKPVKIGEFDVMVARFRGPDDSPQALHLTYISGATKAQVDSPRKIVGTIAKGSAIRLMPLDDSNVLGIAEGIETALSASAMYGVPVWACHSTAVLKGFVPPAVIKAVWIFGDNDSNAAGQLAAYECMRHLRDRGIDAKVVLPRDLDTDWNDVLMESKAA